jgi:hypothetical protein
LLTIAFSSDGQVPLKQFIMDNPLHIPPDAQHGRPERGVSLMSKLPCLKRANHFWAVFSAIESSPYTAQVFRAASAALEPQLNS